MTIWKISTPLYDLFRAPPANIEGVYDIFNFIGLKKYCDDIFCILSVTGSYIAAGMTRYDT